MKLYSLSLVIFIMFTTTSIFAASLLDTGQTKCYDDTKEIPCQSAGQDFYGQDTNYNINPMSFTTIDGIMVKNNVTGLIWELKNSGSPKQVVIYTL